MPDNRQDGRDDRSGRETRLLLLVIAVAVAVLLVLARFRFPEAEIATAAPSPNPLDRIATRATFDELADAVADTATRLMPYITVLEFAAPPEASVRKPDRKSEKKAARPAEVSRYVPGLRVRPDLVIAHAPPGLAPVLVAGASLVALDHDRQIVVISAAPVSRGASVVDLSHSTGFAGSAYVLAIEAGAAGPAARPAFLSRTSPAQVAGWSSTVLRVPGEPQASAGAVLFAMDGRLIGLVLPQADGLAIADGPAIERAVTELASGRQ